MPTAGRFLIVHGGLSASRSQVKNSAGIKWNPMSAGRCSTKSGGITSVRSIATIVQYNTEINTSSGVEHSESVFLAANKRGESVMSASSPKINVSVARRRPMMVRYWKCQPYEALMGFGKLTRYQ